MAGGNFGGGDGSELNPFLVEDIADFNAMRNNPDYYENPLYHFKQVNDLDVNWANFDSTDSWSLGFNGHYDGDNKKIKNITLTTNMLYTCDGVSIKNLIIDGVKVDITDDYFYGVIGLDWNYDIICENVHIINADIKCNGGGEVTVFGYGLDGDSIMTNCSTQGKIQFTTSNDYMYCAGFMLVPYGGTIIQNCYSNVDIDVQYNGDLSSYKDKCISGFIVSITHETQVRNCYYIGNIKCNAFIQINGFANGATYRYIQSEDIITIKQCFVNANIEITTANEQNDFPYAFASLFCGNLYGQRRSGKQMIIKMQDCYAIGSIKFVQSICNKNYIVGYLSGDAVFYSVITNCYSVCLINGESENIKPFIYTEIEPEEEEYPVIQNCYYNYSLLPLSPGTPSGVTPRTTAEMKQQNTYENWDFDEIWNINSKLNDGYPILKHDFNLFFKELYFDELFEQGIGTVDEPYQIIDKDALSIINDNYTEIMEYLATEGMYFKLANNIEFETSEEELYNAIISAINDINELGDYFDYNGYTITLKQELKGGITAINSKRVVLDNVKASIVANKSNMHIKNSTISNKKYAVISSNLSKVTVDNCTGEDNEVGLYAVSGGFIYKRNENSIDAEIPELEEKGGHIFD